MPSTTSTTDVSLAQWVGQVFNDLFFQPDEQIAMKAVDEHVSEDFVAWINTDSFTSAGFRDIVQAARAKDTFVITSNEEILSYDAPDRSGAGSVTLLGGFIAKDKQSGKEVETTSVTITTVGVRDGKRVFLALSETSKEKQ